MNLFPIMIVKTKKKKLNLQRIVKVVQKLSPAIINSISKELCQQKQRHLIANFLSQFLVYILFIHTYSSLEHILALSAKYEPEMISFFQYLEIKSSPMRTIRILYQNVSFDKYHKISKTTSPCNLFTKTLHAGLTYKLHILMFQFEKF